MRRRLVADVFDSKPAHVGVFCCGKQACVLSTQCSARVLPGASLAALRRATGRPRAREKSRAKRLQLHAACYASSVLATHCSAAECKLARARAVSTAVTFRIAEFETARAAPTLSAFTDMHTVHGIGRLRHT